MLSLIISIAGHIIIIRIIEDNQNLLNINTLKSTISNCYEQVFDFTNT
jgi:hypothetical protein